MTVQATGAPLHKWCFASIFDVIREMQYGDIIQSADKLCLRWSTWVCKPMYAHLSATWHISWISKPIALVQRRSLFYTSAGTKHRVSRITWLLLIYSFAWFQYTLRPLILNEMCHRRMQNWISLNFVQSLSMIASSHASLKAPYIHRCILLLIISGPW